MRYIDFDTGEKYTLDELKAIYHQQEDEMQYDSFEDYLDNALALGRQKIGGLVETDEPDLLGNKELIQKLYDHIGHDMDGVENDIKFDFLTQNEGRDGKQYLWYMDSGMMAIIDEDGNISEDHDKIDELFC